jgi:anti-anti-sigma factor
MKSNLTTTVRSTNSTTSIIDIQGEVTGLSEHILMDAYNQASGEQTQNILLNFTSLEYMNSSGIGLLVTLLIRTRRQNQQLMAYGLNSHYQQIFQLTRLNEAIQMFGSEEDALTAAGMTM